jgi:hypothetical protein
MSEMEKADFVSTEAGQFISLTNICDLHKIIIEKCLKLFSCYWTLAALSYSLSQRQVFLWELQVVKHDIFVIFTKKM